MNLLTKQKERLTDLENELMVARGIAGVGAGRDSYRAWDGHVYTVIFKMDNHQGPTI